MWFKLATWILPKVLDIGGGAVNRALEQKKELQEQKHQTAILKEQGKQEVKRAQAEAVKYAAMTETRSVDELTKGWKDEFSLALFLIPLWFILIIFPVLEMAGYDTCENDKPRLPGEKVECAAGSAQGALEHGLEQLALLPEWYWALVMIMVLKTFGVPVANIIGGIANTLFKRSKK